MSGENRGHVPSILEVFGMKRFCIALFDMDGTLFDFDGQMRADLQKMASPSEPQFVNPTDPNYVQDIWEAEKRLPWLKNRMSMIKRQPGWWLNLPIFRLGWDVLDECIHLGYQNEILTKGPEHNSQAWAEKHECLKSHKPLLNYPIHMSDEKGRVYGRVLVDDFKDFIESWLEWRPRGLVIMPASNNNATFKHPNVIRYDGNNFDEVRVALKAAFYREDGQHWKDWKDPSTTEAKDRTSS